MLTLDRLTSATEWVRLMDKGDGARMSWATYAPPPERTPRQRNSRPCADWQALRAWEDDGGR